MTFSKTTISSVMKWAKHMIVTNFFLLTFLNSFFFSIFTVVNVQFLILSGHRDEGVTKFFLALYNTEQILALSRGEGVGFKVKAGSAGGGGAGWEKGKVAFVNLFLKDLFSSGRILQGAGEGKGANIGAAACINPKRLEGDKRKSMLHLHRRLHNQALLVLFSVHFCPF